MAFNMDGNKFNSTNAAPQLSYRTYLLGHKNLVDNANSGHRDSLLLAQHRRRHQHHRGGQMLPTCKKIETRNKNYMHIIWAE